MTKTQALTKGQAVTFDATGLGHTVKAEYIGPHPKGGHSVRVLGKSVRIQHAPRATEGK